MAGPLWALGFPERAGLTRRHATKRREEGFGMFKSSGRHARPRSRWVGPLFAYEAIRLHWEGKKELDASSSAQVAAFRAGIPGALR